MIWIPCLWVEDSVELDVNALLIDLFIQNNLNHQNLQFSLSLSVETGKRFKIQLEKQKALSSQNNFENEEQNSKTSLISRFTVKYHNQDSVVLLEG